MFLKRVIIFFMPMIWCFVIFPMEKKFKESSKVVRFQLPEEKGKSQSSKFLGMKIRKKSIEETTYAVEKYPYDIVFEDEPEDHENKKNWAIGLYSCCLYLFCGKFGPVGW